MSVGLYIAFRAAFTSWWQGWAVESLKYLPPSPSRKNQTAPDIEQDRKNFPLSIHRWPDFPNFRWPASREETQEPIETACKILRISVARMGSPVRRGPTHGRWMRHVQVRDEDCPPWVLGLRTLTTGRAQRGESWGKYHTPQTCLVSWLFFFTF